MSSRRNASPNCSDTIHFKCCKTKQFIHFVCIKCCGVYHKCCVYKFKSKIRFVKDNKLICCGDDSYTSELDEEKDLLEKTINDLSEDSERKDKYIRKIITASEEFSQEASKREEELLEIIKQQENAIQELNELLNRLKLSTAKTKSSEVGIQTNFINNKNASTITDHMSYSGPEKITQITQSTQTCKKPKKPSAEQHLKNKRQKPDIDSTIPLVVQGSTKNSNLNIELAESIKTCNPNVSVKTTKKKILLLTDDENITWQMRRLIDLNKYEVISVRKPGARLNQVLENFESLVKGFTLQDYIIIIGGRNDIDKNETPSFRFICKKLKLCSHTNTLFASIPYYKNASERNKHVYKFNYKLNDFLCKFNNYTEGFLKYIEINDDNSIRVNRNRVATLMVEAIFSNKNKNIHKKLIFIHTNDHNEDSLIQEITQHQLQTDTNEILDNSSSVSYPQLSQIPSNLSHQANSLSVIECTSEEDSVTNHTRSCDSVNSDTPQNSFLDITNQPSQKFP